MEPEQGKTGTGQKKRRKKAAATAAVFVLVIVAAGIGTFLYFHLNGGKRSGGDGGSDINVGKIDIDSWSIKEPAGDDIFEGRLISDETAPFAAVIGSRREEGAALRLVYMENGTGTVTVPEADVPDPSEVYEPLGCLGGRTLEESDIQITCAARDYFEWKVYTACLVDIEAELMGGESGLLCFSVENSLTDETAQNCWMPIVAGTGTYISVISYLPMNTRDVEVTVTPKLFFPAEPLKEGDYTMGDFSVEKKDGDFNTEILGAQELAIAEGGNGIVLYTSTLLEDEDGKRRETFRDFAIFQKGSCLLDTYMLIDTKRKSFVPEYEFEVIGWVRWDGL